MNKKVAWVNGKVQRINGGSFRGIAEIALTQNSSTTTSVLTVRTWRLWCTWWYISTAIETPKFWHSCYIGAALICCVEQYQGRVRIVRIRADGDMNREEQQKTRVFIKRTVEANLTS